MTEKFFVVFLLMVIAALLIIKKHLLKIDLNGPKGATPDSVHGAQNPSRENCAPKKYNFLAQREQNSFCECGCKEMYLAEVGSLAEWVCDCCGKPKKTEDI